MTTLNEPAFPTPHFLGNNGEVQWGANGMTIGDYERIAYTAAAIGGLCANEGFLKCMAEEGPAELSRMVSTQAKLIASAALKAREGEVSK